MHKIVNTWAVALIVMTNFSSVTVAAVPRAGPCQRDADRMGVWRLQTRSGTSVCVTPGISGWAHVKEGAHFAPQMRAVIGQICLPGPKPKRAIAGLSKFKAEFDKLCGVTGWTIHDLRRTSRTLCSRAGADPDHAELAYGHTVQGVRGVYDVWEYRDEKLRVFELLAAQIDPIVNPQDNVVALRIL